MRPVSFLLCVLLDTSLDCLYSKKKQDKLSQFVPISFLDRASNSINVIWSITDTLTQPLTHYTHIDTDAQTACSVLFVSCIHFTGTQPSVNRKWQREWKHAWTLALLLLSPSVFQFLFHRCTPKISQVMLHKGPIIVGGYKALTWQTTKVGWSGAMNLCLVHCDLQRVCLQLAPMCSERAFPWECGLLFRNTRNSQRGAISASNVSQAKRE